MTSLRSSRVKRKSWKFISKLNGSWSGHPEQRNWDWQHSVRDLAPQAPNHWRVLSIKRSNAQSQRAAHLRQFTGPTLAAATPTAASLLATLGKVDRESLKISERAVSQCTLMRGAQDDPGRLVCFKCLLPTRGAQAPTVAWFQAREAKLWHRGGQIVATRFRKRQKLRCHDSADRVASYVLLAGIAAAIAIKPCHGLKRTDLKWLTEYVAGWNWPSASIVMFISKHAPSPQIFDPSSISKSTSG